MMRQRGEMGVVVLSFVTLGIYVIYWVVSTKREMNERGANIPTSSWIVVPFVNIWWKWRYCLGVEGTTGKELSAPLAFLLLGIAGPFGMMIIQTKFNALSERG